jgi:hypothetical protein
MMYLRSYLPSASLSDSLNPNRKTAAAIVAALTLTLAAFSTHAPAQDSPQDQPQSQAKVSMVTLPAGTQLALVLTHPVQSRYVHRGDDIYAQITSPVDSENEVLMPPGTFVQGRVDKLEMRGGRAELRLQSMSITFPDGYVAQVAGPAILESNEGYALKDPGQGKAIGAVMMPVAGAGIGALIGHSVASSQGTTITSSIPPGCSGPPPGCLSSSVTGPPEKGKATMIGTAVGSGIGFAAMLVMMSRSHNFYLDAGTPVDMTLQQPLQLEQARVDDAVQQYAEHPTPPPPVAPRPVPPPLDTSTNTDHGTCYTPDTPGTPPQVIPGAPGPDGIPGPPTVIPGTPPTPGTPYPCP